MTQAIAKIKFLEIPQDSHTEDPNNEDSGQTVQMPFLICVSVVRSTCIRNIHTRGMTNLNYHCGSSNCLPYKKLYHGPGHVITELAYTSVCSRS